MGKVIKILIILIVLAFLWRFFYPLFMSDAKRIEGIVEKTAKMTEEKNMILHNLCHEIVIAI